MNYKIQLFDLHESHGKDLENLLFQLSGKKRIINLSNHPNTYCIGAFMGEKLIGFGQFFILHKTTFTLAHLEDVIVDIDHREHGIGKKILLEIISQAKNKGVSHINLSVRPERGEATNLYESVGFIAQNTTVFRLKL